MIYTLENTIEIGRRVADVIDANGLRWSHCLEINTETGEITRFKTDQNGCLNIQEDDVVYETIKTAAPIRVTFETYG